MGVGFLWVLLSVRGIRVVGIPSGRWPWSLTRRVTSNSIQVTLRAKNPTAASLLNISAASWQIGKLARTKIQIKRQVPSPPTTKLILDALIWPPQQPVKAHCRCQPCSCQAPTPPDGVSEEVKGFSPAKQESAQAPCRSTMASLTHCRGNFKWPAFCYQTFAITLLCCCFCDLILAGSRES